ncbi:hypothetical protein [Microbacterium paludicola]|uniref:hypothetical protein n=1 Tax=Microbacterium paludicola TaxID=300019 RepID=UPI0031DD034C
MNDIRTRRPAVILGGAICLLALAGCSTPVEAPGATATSTPAPETSAPVETPSTEPTPTETTEPSQQPQEPGDVESWTISEEAVGPFELGMPWEETVALAEELGWDTSNAGATEGCAAFVGAPLEAGVEMYAWNYDGVTADISVSALPEVATAGPATAEGITVQSMFADVRAAYPDAMEGEQPIAGHPYLVVDADAAGNAMYVAADGEFIDLISVNSLGTVPYEHC